jgi:hypothetical protein
MFPFSTKVKVKLLVVAGLTAVIAAAMLLT